MTAPSLTAPRVLALLGVRFRDYVTGNVVSDRLQTTARPVTQLDVPVSGVVGPSGVVSFHHVPGLHDLEFPFPDSPTSMPALGTYVITVEDGLGRFLPALFLLDLPLLDTTSLPTLSPRPLIDAFLFAAPTRPVPPGFAAIRAELRDAMTLEAVGHGVLRVDLAGTSGIGVADAGGRVLALLPAPTVDRLRFGSPPGTGQASLGRQTWPVTVSAFALPGLAPPTLIGGRLPDPWGALPTLKAILDTQPQAPIHLTPSTVAATWTDTVTYGEELVFRTQTSSYLMISRGASPP
jgi:hypothetical protein